MRSMYMQSACNIAPHMSLTIAAHNIASSMGCSEHEDLTRRLVTALQDSIMADLNGASENEVKGERNILLSARVGLSRC